MHKTFAAALWMVIAFGTLCLGQAPSEEDAPATAPSDNVLQDTEAAYLDIYADGLMRDERIIEVIRADYPNAKLHVVVYDSTLGQLLAKRGHISALYYLLSTMSDEEREQFLHVARTRKDTGLSVMHHVVLSTKSAYWVDRFAELGVDVELEPNLLGERSFEDLVRHHQQGNDELKSLRRYQQLKAERVLEGENQQCDQSSSANPAKDLAELVEEFAPSSPNSPVAAKSQTPELVEQSQRAWKLHLEGFEKGLSSAEVAERLADQYRDRATIHVGGSGATVEVYLVDDFTELRFHFSLLKGLEGASVHNKSQWVRFPNDQLVLIDE